MIPEDLERQINLAEAEVGEGSGWWGGPSVPSGKVAWALLLQMLFPSLLYFYKLVSETCRWVRL